jgi:hypothetical protein
MGGITFLPCNSPWCKQPSISQHKPTTRFYCIFSPQSQSAYGAVVKATGENDELHGDFVKEDTQIRSTLTTFSFPAVNNTSHKDTIMRT